MGSELSDAFRLGREEPVKLQKRSVDGVHVERNDIYATAACWQLSLRRSLAALLSIRLSAEPRSPRPPSDNSGPLPPPP
jgi:hypothetical protein